MYSFKINDEVIYSHRYYDVIKNLLVTQVELFCDMYVSMRIMDRSLADHYIEGAYNNRSGVNIQDFAHFKIVSD